jgi:hypothetical protein
MEILYALLSNTVQLSAGCITAYAAYRVLYGRSAAVQSSSALQIISILLSSLAGVLLPFGTFGIVPLVILLLAAGFRGYTVVPVLFSNFLFNLPVAYTDPGFTWRTGMGRVLLALVIGIAAGMIMRLAGVNETAIFRNTRLPVPERGRFAMKNFCFVVFANLKYMAAFLLLGAVIGVLFNEYLLWDVINYLFTNPSTSFLPRLFATYNVAHPAFILSMTIVTMFMKFFGLAALIAVLKLRGLAAYIAFYAVWSILLAIPAFI